ncbi:MAG: nucleotidyl transferase AbiEii/AbiGii toxin family protein [bacterium]|nr:nucleotidyl transferase AbiEii/AbiGii toxin family protein [bacterium]
MFKDIIREKLREYSPKNGIEQENILQEIVQYYMLASLARTGFFSIAGFHGGTYLRMVHNLDRFSEDLDFILKKPDRKFKWQEYTGPVLGDLQAEGLKLQIQDRSESNVKKVFLKTDSIGKVILIDLPFSRHNARKIRVKLEIDTNPPKGSEFETQYINFPTVAAITTQSPDSSFSLKSHALLCRKYVKGRDWYDFAWYVSKKTRLNFILLKNALLQIGPWEKQKLSIDMDWYVKNLKEKITGIDWKKAKEDVMRFIPTASQDKLEVWSRDFFINQLEQMKRYMD